MKKLVVVLVGLTAVFAAAGFAADSSNTPAAKTGTQVKPAENSIPPTTQKTDAGKQTTPPATTLKSDKPATQDKKDQAVKKEDKPVQGATPPKTGSNSTVAASGSQTNVAGVVQTKKKTAQTRKKTAVKHHRRRHRHCGCRIHRRHHIHHRHHHRKHVSKQKPVKSLQLKPQTKQAPVTATPTTDPKGKTVPQQSKPVDPAKTGNTTGQTKTNTK